MINSRTIPILILFTLVFSILPSLSSSFHTFNQTESSVALHPMWQELDTHPLHVKKLGGIPVLVGSITFRKRSRESLSLSTIVLQWHGPKLFSLHGSLYKKEPSKIFIPIQEHFISDGLWSTERQTLILNFHKRDLLAATNTYYLILAIPYELHDIIRAGHFSLCTQYLPEVFWDTAMTSILSIAPEQEKQTIAIRSS